VRYFQRESRKAVWSRRCALLAFVLFIAIFALHRVGQIPTPLAMKLTGATILGAIIAVLLAITAFSNIWREGSTGAGKAFGALFFGAAVLAGPIWVTPNILSLPRIHEVSTDLRNPPEFNTVAELRKGEQVNPPDFQQAAAKLQPDAYPDLRPLSLDRSKEDAYSAVRDAVKNLNWQIVGETPPNDRPTGLIEATHRSTVFGFTDDMAIRVIGVGNSTRVDVRASARHGQHDLGRNAERVRDLFSEVKTRLNEIDRTEQMQAALALREAQRQKALKEKERQRLVAEREEREARRRSGSSRRDRQISGSGNAGQGGGNQASRAQSRPAASSGRRGSRKQRQQARTRALRKFWEELNE